MADINGLWIFGYGSLCWNPGFEFNRSITGFIKGFERKFWQGNATHRGTTEKVLFFILNKILSILFDIILIIRLELTYEFR